jgi:5-methylcytosine-specific restriction endonuclease McrA
MSVLRLFTCEVCGESFQSAKPSQRTCGRTCRGRLGGSSPSKRLCQGCGAPASKRGWCRHCSLERKRMARRRAYYKHKARILKQRRTKYASNVEEMRAKSRVSNARSRFNGLREERLQLDGHRCQLCGATEKLVMHHLNEHGGSRSKPDHVSTIEDLLTLCRKCHINLHRRLGDLKTG